MSEELIGKLYASRRYDAANNYQPYYQSALVDLVREMTEEAMAKGLTLSRWETSTGKWGKKITWALHRGERADQARYQREVVGVVILHAVEGTSARCEAYKALQGLRQTLQEAQ